MKHILTACLVLIFMISCSEKKKNKSEIDPKALELNEQGVKFMKEFKNDSALILFDKAIEADETYYQPNSSKAGIYINLREYPKALVESELAIKKNPDFAEGWTRAGMLNEKLGNSEKAAKYYQKSIELFDKRINDPEKKDRIVQNKLSRALSLVLLGKEDKAKEELTKLKNENPNNSMITNFMDIKKKEFLEQILQ